MFQFLILDLGQLLLKIEDWFPHLLIYLFQETNDVGNKVPDFAIQSEFPFFEQFV